MSSLCEQADAAQFDEVVESGFGWLPGASVDERDAELGAHEGELVRAVVGTVVDVEPQRKPAAGERALEHRQERGGALGEVEGGEGERAGGIVDEGHEEGLSASAPIADLRSVHDIAHPQLAGVAEGEASPVDGDGLAGAFVEKAFAREQPMHRRGSQRALDPALARRADEGVDRERGLLGLQPHEQLGDIGGQTARPAAVDTGLRIQRLEAAAAVQRQPIADGLGGNAGAPRTGDGVGVLGLLTQPLADARCARGEMGEVAGEPRLVPKLQPAVARRGRFPARANSFSTEGVSRLRHGSCDTKR